MPETAVLPLSVPTTSINTEHMTTSKKNKLARNFCAFLDVVCTATSRATFYNTKEEQQAAVQRAHEAIFGVDRGIYQMTLMLPGVTDYSKQAGIAKLLSSPIRDTVFSLSPELEMQVIAWVIDHLPPQRALKLFCTFIGKKDGDSRIGSIKNSRTCKTILSWLLNHKNLSLFAVKYRSKVRTVLVHCWGKRKASIIKSILSKESHDAKELRILDDSFKKYGGKNSFSYVLESIAFVLGSTYTWKEELFIAFKNAKEKGIEHGKRLPPEVLEGLRGRFWKDSKKSEVIKITKDTMTSTQKRQVQKRAKAANIEVEFNPYEHDIVQLYIYAYEMGMTKEIESAINKKAKDIAETLPLGVEKAAIIVDGSESMFGHGSQKLRPISIALSVRDVLNKLVSDSKVFYCGGTRDGRLIRTSGDTSLAEQLVEAIEWGPDAVFIISDGYENAPAGRTAEVIYFLRKIGIQTPIYHLSPVMAAEITGMRALSEDVKPLPISSPSALGIPMLKALFESDVDQGIAYLSGLTLPLLEKKEA